MATYKETRTLDASGLRSICIRNNWYTCGDCLEYERLFDRLYDNSGCNIHLTTEKLAEIAQDIYDHSDIEDYTVTAIMFELARNCLVVFEEVET